MDTPEEDVDVEGERETGRGDNGWRVTEARGTSETNVEVLACIAVLTWDVANSEVEEAGTS